MISEQELKSLIGKVLSEINPNELKPELLQSQIEAATASVVKSTNESATVIDDVADDQLVDITEIDTSEYMAIDNPENREEYMKLKAKTPARLGIGHAGPRYKTLTMLRFRADHAVAIDAVFNDVPDEFIERNQLISLQTRVDDKDMYVTRPDLGRILGDASVEKLKAEMSRDAAVQIVVCDGLSSTAITANLENILPALKQGLEGYGLKVGKPIFVKYGRVGAMDHVTEVTNADVTVCLVGERPGLATGESMGAYLTWRGTRGMPEANRTVVSNIHKRGTPSAEAGAHVANIVKTIADQKMSGVELKL